MVSLSLPLPNNTVQNFSASKDLPLGRFLFMIVTPCKLVKTMFKWIFLSLIFTPRCKYTYTVVKTIKFLVLTSSELYQELFWLNKIVCCFKVLFYF